MSLNAFYHLLPKPRGLKHSRRQALSRMLSPTIGQTFWQLMDALGVHKEEYIPSSRAAQMATGGASETSSSDQEDPIDEDVQPIPPLGNTLSFSMFMGTPKMLLGCVAWCGGVRT